MYKGKGRPPNKIECKRKTIYLRVDIIEALRTYSNQSAAINEALENYIFHKDKSDEMILTEIDSYQKIIKALQSRLVNNKKLREQHRVELEKQKAKELVFKEIKDNSESRNEKQLKIWADIKLKRVGSDWNEYTIWRDKPGD